MIIKAARDVLDYKGKHWVEFAESDVDVGNFDPVKIMREVVKTGKFKADASKMERPSLEHGTETKVAAGFSKGRKFQWNAYGVIKMMACDFIPVGLQYIVYDRAKEDRKWIETEEDVMSKVGAK